MNNYRNAAVAGLFYPANPVVLKDDIETMLASCKTTVEYSGIFGLIAPHAGYVYSGTTAAYAYNLLYGRNIKTVVILSPSHKEYFQGSCIYKGDGYVTPFGKIKIDKEIKDKIIASGSTVFSGREGHGKEHAVEVHLPFLQYILQDFKIIPLVMGDQNKKYVDDLASALAASVDDNTMIITSSDLSHFHSRDEAAALDNVVERNIIDLDFENLLRNIETGKGEACGGGLIAVLLKAASLKNVNRSAILKRSDSADITGNTGEVVGYLSAVVYH